MEEKNFLTAKETADYLGICLPNVYKLLESKQIAGARVSKKWLISKRSVYEFGNGIERGHIKTETVCVDQRDMVVAILMDSLEKTKKKFDEAIQNDQAFEAATYGGQLTDMSKELLAHYRAEYEEQALERLMKSGKQRENA